MTRSVILDIGAGSRYFARRLRWYNWRKPQLIFCGEPWGGEYWKIDAGPVCTRELIQENKRGIFRVVSEYSKFDFDDESLHMVTLNSPHVLMPPNGIENELKRCLKSGGIFFFSYPIHFELSKTLEGMFTLLARKRFGNNASINLGSISGFPEHLPHKMVASKTMKSNIITSLQRKMKGYHKPERISYVYHNTPLCNEYEVWQKI